jgi:hypothetical protein
VKIHICVLDPTSKRRDFHLFSAPFGKVYASESDVALPSF